MYQLHFGDYEVTIAPSGRNEWYTPPSLIARVARVLGTIDLDPASCALANEAVRARAFYTREDDGLTRCWQGRVYLNPPYSHEDERRGMGGAKREGPTALFVKKLLDEYRAGNVTEAILCVNADTCRSWFAPLWDFPICFVYEPVQFIRPGGEKEHHFFGTAFVYLGTNIQSFIDVFHSIGAVALRIGEKP